MKFIHRILIVKKINKVNFVLVDFRFPVEIDDTFVRASNKILLSINGQLIINNPAKILETFPPKINLSQQYDRDFPLNFLARSDRIFNFCFVEL